MYLGSCDPLSSKTEKIKILGMKACQYCDKVTGANRLVTTS